MIETQTQKGRKEIREISVYSAPKSLKSSWKGLESIIEIKRKITVKEEKKEGTYYYISSLSSRTKAKTFGGKIRNHWGIETYHYLKDVVLKEDCSKIKKGNGPSNMSILRNIGLNIFHDHKIKKITQATRLLRNNTKKMMDMISA